MILSVAHKFIFVRGRKVGGTSVEIALSTICGPDDIASPLIPVDEKLRQEMGGTCANYGGSPAMKALYVRLVKESTADTLHLLSVPPSNYEAHMPLAKVIESHTGPLDGFRVVSMVRSPYARVLSALNMKSGFDAYRRGRPLLSDIQTWPRVFDEMFEGGGIHVLRLIDKYWDTAIKLSLQAIRYENLQSDFGAFVANISVQHTVTLPHAKRGRMSNELDPLQLLRRDQIDKINDVFAAEFDAFGYSRL